MNERKRKRLKDAIRFLNSALSIVESVKDDEQDDLDNIPENLQGSARYEAMETAIDKLSDAESSIDEAINSIEEAGG